MDLLDWPEVEASATPWRAILIGNGASRNVFSRFNYSSLYERACGMRSRYRLKEPDQALFDKFGTQDFEIVLGHLQSARRVAEVLGFDAREIAALDESYDRVKNALAAAVQSVHPSYGRVEERLETIGKALLKYSWVFSTNYDLLVYWAMAKVGWDGFYDFMKGQPPRWRAANKLAPVKRTKVLFLHGCLHLYVEQDGVHVGETMKRVGGDLNILDQLLLFDEAPLVVAEGSADDKRRVISDYPYLTFGLQRLSMLRGPMVIFGTKLGPSDAHLVEALQPSAGRRLAIAIHEAGSDAKREMARLSAMFGDADALVFFSAKSHPLGDPSLRVSVSTFLGD